MWVSINVGVLRLCLSNLKEIEEEHCIISVKDVFKQVNRNCWWILGLWTGKKNLYYHLYKNKSFQSMNELSGKPNGQESEIEKPERNKYISVLLLFCNLIFTILVS